MNIIEVKGVTKKFNRRGTRKLLGQHFRDMFRETHADHTFVALQDISFDIAEAEGVQIVGANGAGKSTLLSVITGLAEPDAGKVNVNGRIGALLDLGSGFHPDLSGMENLTLNAALIGIGEARTRELTPKIIDFAELGSAIHEPLRTFSAGMVMRLAFSVAISLEPDILIVDEVLGVGDASFQRKCREAIRRLRQRGTALLFVSHLTGLTEELCSRAIWLHHGKLVLDAPYQETMKRYQEFMAAPDTDTLPGGPASLTRT
jgi:lipopolysaccharide transport system ATP-binding protein